MSLETLFPLIISNTDMELWSQCQLKWFRERCQNLRRAGKSIDLLAGGAFAAGLEIARKSYYVDKQDSDTAIDLGYHHILAEMHKELMDTDVLKSPERTAMALVTYSQKFPFEMEDTIPAELEEGGSAIEHKLTAELPIEHPELGIPLIFKGKLDMLATQMGRTYIVDEKTTKAISANQADLLRTAGQFIGYAWLVREKGITVVGAKIRKVAIQVKEIKVQEFEVPITDYMIDLWYQALLQKVEKMVRSYELVKQGFNFKAIFLPDFQNGCTAYFRPCAFMDGCSSKNGENFIESNFEQVVWDSINRKEIELKEYKQLLGV